MSMKQEVINIPFGKKCRAKGWKKGKIVYMKPEVSTDYVTPYGKIRLSVCMGKSVELFC
jgi:hypothetical protein